MARFEGELIAAGEVALDLGDMARSLAGSSDAELGRRLAMARLLSATKGWKAAAAVLDGTFAKPLGEAGLTRHEQR